MKSPVKYVKWIPGWFAGPLLLMAMVPAFALDAAPAGNLWKISESPLGVRLNHAREPVKLSSITLSHQGYNYGLRYIQHGFADSESSTVLSCKKMPVTRCDPATYAAGFLVGTEQALAAGRFYVAGGLSYFYRGRKGHRQHAVSLPLELGWYRTFGRYFGLGPIVFAEINRYQPLTGVLVSLNYGVLR